MASVPQQEPIIIRPCDPARPEVRHNPAMAFRRSALLFKLLLALMFLGAQQQAVLHTLGHSFERIEQKKDGAGLDESFCAKCLAVAQLDHTVGATKFQFATADFAAPRSPSPTYRNARRTAVRRYESRAPPSFT